MPTTARIITRPYRATTCRVRERQDTTQHIELITVGLIIVAFTAVIVAAAWIFAGDIDAMAVSGLVRR